MSANVVESLVPPLSSEPLELVIRPRRGWIAIDWAEMVRYRELLYFLIWRDVKVRYKQTMLGFAWAVIQPLLNAVIAAVIFGAVASFQKLLPADVPYILFSFVGMLPWQLFSTGLSTGGMSLMNQQNLLTKIYFPRLFLPTSSVGGALVDFLISFSVMGAFMVGFHFSHYHFTPSWSLLLMPLLIIPSVIAALGVAYLLSAVTVVFRDLRFLIAFFSPILMELSFVMLPRELILQHAKYAKYEWVLALNPMYGIIESYRHLVLHMSWNPMHLVTGTAVACGMCVVGMFYFRKTERRFADIA